MECGVAGRPGEGNRRELAHVPSTRRALARAGGLASHAHVSASVQVAGKPGARPAWRPSALATSTYLRLLVVLVLDAIDLLQQVADPVHLESGKAAGHLPAPTQAFSAPTWPNTTSQVPGSVPGAGPVGNSVPPHPRRGVRRNCYLPRPPAARAVGPGARWSCPPQRRAWSQAPHRPSNHSCAHLTIPNLEKKHFRPTHHQSHRRAQGPISRCPHSEVVSTAMFPTGPQTALLRATVLLVSSPATSIPTTAEVSSPPAYSGWICQSSPYFPFPGCGFHT